MALSIFIILFIFFWFVGFDLLKQLLHAGAADESRAVKMLAMQPGRNFTQQRKKFEPILIKNFEYYRLLSENSKLKFLLRCFTFIKNKEFQGRDGLIVTDEMKLQIAAAAVQLTFGLHDFLLRHFHTFLIYPDVYVSPASGALHKGETSLRGVIVLSWKHFVEGYELSTDKLNLGLHELAHALDLSRIVKATDPFFFDYFAKWQAASDTTFNEVNRSEEHYLRKYSGTDEREFFAVCVEHFFEDPHGFKKNIPQLYSHLSVLLKQDPCLLGVSEHTQLCWKPNHPGFLLPLHEKDVKFKSVFPLWHASKGIVLPFAFYYFFSYLNPKADLTAFFYLFATFSGLGCINFFYRSRILVVTEDYILIRSVIIPSMIRTYAIDNIISIRYNAGWTEGSLKFSYLEEGEVESRSFNIGLIRAEYDNFKAAMHNRDVLMTV